MSRRFVMSESEHWNEYRLDDGTLLRVKIVMVSVNRLDGEYGEEGDPRYVFKSQLVTDVVVPEELKKKPS